MRKNVNKLSAWHIKVADRISNVLLKTQRAWAGLMDRYFNQLSLPLRKLYFIAWCFLVASVCSLLILKPFYHRPQRGPLQKIRPVSIPAFKIPTSPAKADQDDVNDAIYNFNRFRDSLRVEGGAAWLEFRRMYELTNTDTIKTIVK